MAETVKKAKAPAKPRAATKEATTTPTEDTPKVNSKTTTAKAAPRVPTYEEIARLAQQYWAERGHADGHAEQDWLRAEHELRKRAS